jgi:RecA/RadA recombinase
MAKNKKPKWAANETSSAYDSLFQQVTEAARAKYPDHQIYSGGADAMRIVCLPVPAFAVRFLLQQEGWPMGRFAQLVGIHESCKSSLGYEILRWHGNVPGGGGILFPTEPKDAPELFRSIVGYDHPRMRWHDKCKTVQEWNAAVATWVKTFKKLMDGTKAEPGPGRKAPIGLMVDSLMANLSDSEYATLSQDGASSRHYAEVANLLTDYIRYITQEIDDYPFTLIGVNHLKPSKEKVGMFFKDIRNIAGGGALKFFETVEIEMKRLSGIAPGKGVDRKSEDEKGIQLEISIFKNSLAPHEKIKVEMLWYTDYEDRDPAGHFRQKTFFDWYSSSVEILAELTKGEGKQAKRLRKVIELEVMTDSRRVVSPTLGITPKSKVSYREAGEILEKKLHDDAGFRDALYAETGIRRRYLFQPHEDYREQMKKAADLARGSELATAAASESVLSKVAPEVPASWQNNTGETEESDIDDAAPITEEEAAADDSTDASS